MKNKFKIAYACLCGIGTFAILLSTIYALFLYRFLYLIPKNMSDTMFGLINLAYLLIGAFFGYYISTTPKDKKWKRIIFIGNFILGTLFIIIITISSFILGVGNN